MSNTQGAELGQFIPFVACLGQSKMANLGYTPLPPNLVEDDFRPQGDSQVERRRRRRPQRTAKTRRLRLHLRTESREQPSASTARAYSRTVVSEVAHRPAGPLIDSMA